MFINRNNEDIHRRPFSDSIADWMIIRVHRDGRRMR
jgi:hypothetical protein